MAELVKFTVHTWYFPRSQLIFENENEFAVSGNFGNLFQEFMISCRKFEIFVVLFKMETYSPASYMSGSGIYYDV